MGWFGPAEECGCCDLTPCPCVDGYDIVTSFTSASSGCDCEGVVETNLVDSYLGLTSTCRSTHNISGGGICLGPSCDPYGSTHGPVTIWGTVFHQFCASLITEGMTLVLQLFRIGSQTKLEVKLRVPHVVYDGCIIYDDIDDVYVLRNRCLDESCTFQEQIDTYLARWYSTYVFSKIIDDCTELDTSVQLDFEQKIQSYGTCIISPYYQDQVGFQIVPPNNLPMTDPCNFSTAIVTMKRQ